MAMAGAPPGVGAGGPTFPVAPSTTSVYNFKRATLAQPLPYGQDYEPMYQFWSGDSPHTPTQLITEVVSSRVSIQSYIVLHDPFIYPASPGLNQTIWFINDIGAADATLSLVGQPTNLFHVANNMALPPDADFSAAVTAATMGQSK
jgi:hypothetical protein